MTEVLGAEVECRRHLRDPGVVDEDIDTAGEFDRSGDARFWPSGRSEINLDGMGIVEFVDEFGESFGPTGGHHDRCAAAEATRANRAPRPLLAPVIRATLSSRRKAAVGSVLVI